MRNSKLAHDHLQRAQTRLRALDVLYQAESWADVVRESQEIVELGLKALLRASLIEPPRVHDVSDVLLAHRAHLPPELATEIDGLAAISRELRRDRELAFYGAEDINPSEFYRREDAEIAREGARRTIALVAPHITSRPG